MTLSDELLADFKYTLLYKLNQHEAEGYARAIGTSCFQTDKELSHTVEEFIYEDLSHYNTYIGRGVGKLLDELPSPTSH